MELHELWDQLMLKLQIKGKLLIQAQQLQVYLRNVDDALAWISEHETTVLSHEMGADLEINEVLQKKFDVFLKVCVILIIVFNLFRSVNFLKTSLSSCKKKHDLPRYQKKIKMMTRLQKIYHVN